MPKLVLCRIKAKNQQTLKNWPNSMKHTQKLFFQVKIFIFSPFKKVYCKMEFIVELANRLNSPFIFLGANLLIIVFFHENSLITSNAHSAIFSKIILKNR